MSTAINAFRKIGSWLCNITVFADVDFMAVQTTDTPAQALQNILIKHNVLQNILMKHQIALIVKNIIIPCAEMFSQKNSR